MTVTLSDTEAGEGFSLVDADLRLPGYVGEPFPGSDRASAAENARRPINVLMLCDLYPLSYRVMRCLDAAGAAVHVLGGPGSNGLRFSRSCRSYHRSRYEFATPCDGMSGEINAHIGELSIDLVLAGDHGATRTLIALAASLDAPHFPMPTLAQFDLLNNKWSFTQFCRRLGIRCPRSELVADRAELLRRLDAGDIAMPCIAKPLDLHGSRGVIALRTRKDFAAAAAIEYRPILVQDYIDGDDICASVCCDRGEIRVFIAHRLKRSTYATFQSAEIHDAIRRIAEATQVSGILCFDMRRDRDGNIYWLECNPRFFYSMYFAMLTGINFAAFGLPHAGSSPCASVPAGTSVRAFKAIAAELPRPWRLTSRDWAFLRYIGADPVPVLRQWLRIDR